MANPPKKLRKLSIPDHPLLAIEGQPTDFESTKRRLAALREAGILQVIEAELDGRTPKLTAFIHDDSRPTTSAKAPASLAEAAQASDPR